MLWSGGAVAQSVERATSGQKVVGVIPAGAGSLHVGSVSVYNVTVLDKSWSPPSLSLCGST